MRKCKEEWGLRDLAVRSCTVEWKENVEYEVRNAAHEAEHA